MKMEQYDIKLLVEDVIKERWREFLTTHLPTLLPSPERSPSFYKLYTNVDDWVNDMVDVSTGKYIGPEFKIYSSFVNFDNDEVIIHDFTDPFPAKLMYIVMKWNELIKEKYPDIDGDVVKTNKMVRDNFMSDHEESIIGDPPWPVYKKSRKSKSDVSNIN